uniref:Uncharacterized protein n=1 Tax=Amphimedon queenslandica TaxID=400682 RepID=A0A1X7SUU2_AMPQE
MLIQALTTRDHSVLVGGVCKSDTAPVDGDRQTDRQKDRQTDRGREGGREGGKERGRETDRQTETERGKFRDS